MFFIINMFYLGVLKVILEGVGLVVENECVVLGMVICFFWL